MADIVLRDRTGAQIQYPGIERIKLNTADGGTREFVDAETLPDIVESVPIALDFSGGNQTVTLPDGTAAKSAIIEKPANLVPVNIAEGVEIAGIIGALAAGGGGDIKIAVGTFTGKGKAAMILDHNLGVVPDVFVAYCDASYKITGSGCSAVFIGVSSAFKDKYGITNAQYGVVPRSSTELITETVSTGIDTTESIRTIYNATDTQITLGSTYVGSFSTTYTWLAIGGLV